MDWDLRLSLVPLAAALAPRPAPDPGPLWMAISLAALAVVAWTALGLVSPKLTAKVPVTRWATTRARVLGTGVLVFVILYRLLRYDPAYVETERMDAAAREAREDSARAAQEAAQHPLRLYSDAQRTDVVTFRAALYGAVKRCEAAEAEFVGARQRMDPQLMRYAQSLEGECSQAEAVVDNMDTPESLPSSLRSLLGAARSDFEDGAEHWTKSARFAQRALTTGRTPRSITNDQIADPAAEWTHYMNTNEESGAFWFGSGRGRIDEVAVAVGLPPGPPQAGS